MDGKKKLFTETLGKIWQGSVDDDNVMVTDLLSDELVFF